jgi:hypothetical protein
MCFGIVFEEGSECDPGKRNVILYLEVCFEQTGTSCILILFENYTSVLQNKSKS